MNAKVTLEVAELFDLLVANRALIQIIVGLTRFCIDVAPLHVVLAEIGSGLALTVDEEAYGVFLALMVLLLLKKLLFRARVNQLFLQLRVAFVFK